MPSPAQRYPGLDQTTHWLPQRGYVSNSPVVLQLGGVRFHKDGLVLLGLVAIIVILQVGGRALDLTESSEDIGLALACVMGWTITLSPMHHEWAHAAVARREGITVLAAGYSAGRAYVLLAPPATGVTVRAWIRTLAAGAVSNAVVALLALAWWMGRGPELDPNGAFLLGVCATELLAAITNSAPVANTDGRQIRDALHLARSPASRAFE